MTSTCVIPAVCGREAREIWESQAHRLPWWGGDLFLPELRMSQKSNIILCSYSQEIFTRNLKILFQNIDNYTVKGGSQGLTELISYSWLLKFIDFALTLYTITLPSFPFSLLPTANQGMYWDPNGVFHSIFKLFTMLNSLRGARGGCDTTGDL